MKSLFLKSSILFLLTLSFLFCFADKWQGDYDATDGLYKDGYYEEAKEKAKDLIDFTKDEFGVNSPEMGHAYKILGLIESRLGNFELSEESFKKGITSFENSGEKEKSNVAILKSNLGDLYYQNFFDENAQDYLEDAVKILENLNDGGKYNTNLEIPYYDLYSIYNDGAYFADAASTLKKLIDVEKKNYGKTDTIVGVDLRNLGWVYVMWGKYDDAATYMEEAIEIHEKNGGNENDLLGLAYNDYGVLFDYKQEYEKAIEEYKKAADIFKKSKNDKALGNTYNNIGLAYQKLFENTSAIEFYTKAYNIYKSIYGDDDENTQEVKKNLDSVK